MDLIENTSCFGGKNQVYQHYSHACNCKMTFGIYLPPQAEEAEVPVLWYLSGLTCNHENAMSKAGLQEYAAELGIAVVFPDTSPRGEDVANDDAYDLGQGAGFYVNATQEPWAAHFQMYDYIVDELFNLVSENFPISGRHGITGHSMGGHGALTIAMRNPNKYQSTSAFSPIANPTCSDWGRKQLSAYLGDDKSIWELHDASVLMKTKGWAKDLLLDQGGDDQFFDLLRPNVLKEAADSAGIDLVYREHPGYNHSYYFVSSFAKSHVEWHAKRLK